MSRIKLVGVSLVAVLAMGGAMASAASAEEVLTLYANGKPLPIGPAESDPFELITTSPVSITVPETGLSITCPVTGEALLGGWVVANGQKTDGVQFNEEGGLNEVRDCSGATISGPLLVGALELRVNGEARLIAPPAQRREFQLEVNGCYFFATKLKATATIDEPLTVSFEGVLKGDEAGCPLQASIKTGPFRAYFESQRVADRVHS